MEDDLDYNQLITKLAQDNDTKGLVYACAKHADKKAKEAMDEVQECDAMYRDINKVNEAHTALRKNLEEESLKAAQSNERKNKV